MAAPPPQVQLLALLVLGRAGAEMVLDAGPRGEGAAAAEGNTIHQVLSLHITPHTTEREEQELLLLHAEQLVSQSFH